MEIKKGRLCTRYFENKELVAYSWIDEPNVYYPAIKTDFEKAAGISRKLTYEELEERLSGKEETFSLGDKVFVVWENDEITGEEYAPFVNDVFVSHSLRKCKEFVYLIKYHQKMRLEEEMGELLK